VKCVALVYLIFEFRTLNNDLCQMVERAHFSKRYQMQKRNKLANDRNEQAIGRRMRNKKYNSGAMAHYTTSHLLLYYVHTEHQMTIELMFDGRRRVPRLRHIIQCSVRSKLISINGLPSAQSRSFVQDEQIQYPATLYSTLIQNPRNKTPAAICSGLKNIQHGQGG